MVGDQNVGDTAVDHGFGFADFLATDTDCAQAHLGLGYRGRLVHLRVRPQAQFSGAGELGHACQVALETVLFEQQGRGIDFLDPHACLRWRRPGR